VPIFVVTNGVSFVDIFKNENIAKEQIIIRYGFKMQRGSALCSF